MQTIFDEIKAKARGVKALVTHAKNLAHPKKMFCLKFLIVLA
jgi:hypothetical protein